MSKKTGLAMLLVSFALPLSAQETADVEVDGELRIGVEQIDVDTNSSKFNEYRDRRDGLLVDRLWLDLFEPGTGRYFELAGDRLGRRDQGLWLRAGRFGVWDLGVDWTETPHLLSNKAQTPYIDMGNGRFEVPANIPVIFRRLATSGADAANVVATDSLVAAYLAQYLHPTTLGTQRDRGEARLSFAAAPGFDVRARIIDEQKSGSKLGYGPIGDRPPRTLNIQLAEPVDYRTRGVELEAEHVGERFQMAVAYQLSEFENEIDTFTWENIWATPAPGADFQEWDRAVSAFGRRPLSPDNRLQQLTARFGASGPWNGRLDANVSYGIIEQDATLLPYSYAESILVSPDLPRDSADAEMVTTHANLTYLAKPTEALSLRGYLRYYDLENNTPESQWWYVTSDTSNLNGTRSYKNNRVSLAYAFDRLELGAEGTWRVGPWRSAWTVLLEREDVARAYREADTTEDLVQFQWRARPSGTVNLRLKVAVADREGDGYNGFVTRESYWYAPSAAGTDADDPQFTFSNHPDMRRYDVSDRRRETVDFNATWTPRPELVVSVSALARDDDYDSNVTPSQPLLGTGLADQQATSPGDQLGLLDTSQRRAAIDLAWTPNETLTFSAFLIADGTESFQRSLEYNENNKENPSAVATAELGPWTRAESQWTADIDDESASLGLGFNWQVRPDQIAVRYEASWTRGRTDIDYQGFGVTNWNGTPFPTNHQFQFGDAPTIENELFRLESAVDFPFVGATKMTVGYLYERYDIEDWQQEANTPWFESVGSEYLLRDSSRSHQWGNRLVNMGSYLAPGYRGHLGYLMVSYRF